MNFSLRFGLQSRRLDQASTVIFRPSAAFGGWLFNSDICKIPGMFTLATNTPCSGWKALACSDTPLIGQMGFDLSFFSGRNNKSGGSQVEAAFRGFAKRQGKHGIPRFPLKFATFGKTWATRKAVRHGGWSVRVYAPPRRTVPFPRGNGRVQCWRGSDNPASGPPMKDLPPNSSRAIH